jgi:hypothetical protein
MNLRIQRKKRSAVEKKQRQAEKEEHALEVALPPIAENYDHPEKLRQRSCREPNQPDIDERFHRDSYTEILCRDTGHHNGQVPDFSCSIHDIDK